jgi:hypothetical protein
MKRVIDDAAGTLDRVLYGKVGKKEQVRLDETLSENVRDPFYFAALVHDHLGGMDVGNEDDEDLPKRPRTAYNFYTSERKSQSRLNVPKQAVIADEWKQMDDYKKGKYEVLVSKDKKRYEKEIKKYEEENGPISQKLPRNGKTRKHALRASFKQLLVEFDECVSQLKSQREVILFQVHLHVSSCMFLNDGHPHLVFPMPHHDETFDRGKAFIDTWIGQAKFLIEEGKDKQLAIMLALVVMKTVALGLTVHKLV